MDGKRHGWGDTPYLRHPGVENKKIYTFPLLPTDFRGITIILCPDPKTRFAGKYPPLCFLKRVV